MKEINQYEAIKTDRSLLEHPHQVKFGFESTRYYNPANNNGRPTEQSRKKMCISIALFVTILGSLHGESARAGIHNIPIPGKFTLTEQQSLNRDINQSTANKINMKNNQLNQDTDTTEKVVEVKHVVINVKSSFHEFTTNLEKLVGRFDPVVLKNNLKDPEVLKKKVEAMQGEQDLMLFGIQDHGSLMVLYGKHANAKQYLIGNPIIASTMTRYDLRAALYAPLRVLVYEDINHITKVEYDLPSSQFGQFGNPEVSKVGAALDVKLMNLIRKADHQ